MDARFQVRGLLSSEAENLTGAEGDSHRMGEERRSARRGGRTHTRGDGTDVGTEKD